MKKTYIALLFCVAFLVNACTEKNTRQDKKLLSEKQELKVKDSLAIPVETDKELLDDNDVPPLFPGGLDSMRAYVRRNIRYPKLALKLKKQGRVIISAQVDVNGRLSQFKVIQTEDSIFNDEALRIAKTMPRFTPAQKDGKVVASICKIPIMFRLENK